jgi:hypothetical protein
MFAQSLVEYGVLSAALASLGEVPWMVTERLTEVSSTTWLIVAALVIAAKVLRRR